MTKSRLSAAKFLAQCQIVVKWLAKLGFEPVSALTPKPTAFHSNNYNS